MFPADVTYSVSVYHLPTASGVQSYPSTPDLTVTGALLPMDQQQHLLEGGEYQQPYNLYLDPAADVRVSDKLVIRIDVNGTATDTTFFVKKVFPAPFGQIAHKRFSVSTQP